MGPMIDNPNLFRMAVLLELVGLTVESVTLMGGGGGLGPAVGMAMILLGIILYTASVASLFRTDVEPVEARIQ